MSAIEHLPRRPLEREDVLTLGEANGLDVVPYGGLQEGDDLRVYALKLAAGGTAHALGFDDSTEEWQRLATVDGTDLAAADEELDGVLDQWILERYGGRFEVIKSV